MDRIAAAFQKIDRAEFLPEDLRAEAMFDVPVPIGFGQTNSQPTTVALMFDWLEPEPGDKILDIGSGSGWTTALLAWIVGPKGSVYAVEKVPELVEMSRNNCAKFGFKNVRFFQAGKKLGLARHAPYDRILVSASTNELPADLVSQLKPGGKMVVPEISDILEVVKNAEGQLEINPHSGFVFVPLIEDK